MGDQRRREAEIIRASIVGIVGNMVLVLFKLVVGFLSNSIAIILDAVNNATDALSSIITIIGTKLADMRPSRKHPFGYGRVEYLTSIVIAIIILVAGALSLRESIDKVIHPAQTNYTSITITVIVVAIIAKIAIGIYFHRAGKRTDSKALIASGVDSNYDAVLSAGTLVVAIVQLAWNVNIDGIVGIIISLVVVKAGIDVLADATSPIIGLREDDGFGQRIEEYVSGFDGVQGVCDLLLDDFGPNEVIGALHIEVADDMNARQIHELTRTITEGLTEKFGITAIVGIYAENTTGRFAEVKQELLRIAEERPEILQVHGFYGDEGTDTVYFDLVIDFKADEERIEKEVLARLESEYPAYDYNVVVDRDYEG